MNIILLGPPGSGKGTQAEKLSTELNLFYLQTGSLAREWSKNDPKIKEIVDSGKLIPEELMTPYVMQYLETKVPEGKNILFEGFPRFINQYQQYEKWLGTKGQKIDAVISLDISEDSVVKRLSSRRICENCGEVYNLITNPPPEADVCHCGGPLIQRADDNPESIKVRFRYFHENTQQLINYLRQQNKVIGIDADRPIETIFNDIIDNLKNYERQNTN
jgi:adenylate kinase